MKTKKKKIKSQSRFLSHLNFFVNVICRIVKSFLVLFSTVEWFIATYTNAHFFLVGKHMYSELQKRKKRMKNT